MTFESILYESSDCDSPGPPVHDTSEEPEYFRDLNLGQIVDAITAEKAEYDLKPLFHAPLRSAPAVQYRHDIMKDLEQEPRLEVVRSFALGMRIMRRQLRNAEQFHDTYQKQRWLLHAAETYCAAVDALSEQLAASRPSARGLRDLLAYLDAYTGSAAFQSLALESRALASQLADIRYSVLLTESSVRVEKYERESDYSLEIAATFEKFRQGAAKDYRVALPSPLEMNHIEAKIIEFVVELFPQVFAELARFSLEHHSFADPALARFDREVQFYVSYIEFMRTFDGSGLRFSYPAISTDPTSVHARDVFDLSLALRLLPDRQPVVCNDFALEGVERVVIVSGPNQGGKTTFLRTFGQLHHLAAIGCPVAASEARLLLSDAIFTHFEREERGEAMRGKLEDDLIRMRDILARATSRSIVIVNEIFGSTTAGDAAFLARQIIEKILELDLLCVYVTFLDELATISEKIIGMASTVDRENPAVRTYKIVRRAAGPAYAVTIAEKYRVTYDDVKRRLSTMVLP